MIGSGSNTVRKSVRTVTASRLVSFDIFLTLKYCKELTSYCICCVHEIRDRDTTRVLNRRVPVRLYRLALRPNDNDEDERRHADDRHVQVKRPPQPSLESRQIEEKDNGRDLRET